MWKLNPTDLLQLKGGGGEPFVHFMDRLIRAEAACRGLPQAEIATQLRVNVTDGGVDTEVRQAIPQDKTGWFAVPTCWQFKAVDAKDIDKKKKAKKNELQKEINKPFARKLIEAGYGYRLCLIGDLSPEKLQAWETLLKKEALAINPGAQDPRVVHGGHLLQWAERFPAIVAALRNWTQSGLHWEAWKENCRAVTPKYVRHGDRVWEELRRQILEHAQLTGPCVAGEACLAINGAAGVGKTRLVFETLDELTQASGLVLYLGDEQDVRAAATAMATTPGQTAILVADECGAKTRNFLNENLRGHTNRIRVICLDNVGERLVSAEGQVWLTGDSLTNTEAILSANFPLVPEDRRRRYVSVTKGFVRFAADMCRHDSEIATGDMSAIQLTVESYVRERLRRMGETCLPIVSLLSLFNKVGSRDDVVGELEALRGLTPYTTREFYDVVRVVRESPGFVVQTGRYWYVSPEIVASVLFAEGWERWVRVNPGLFFEKLPTEFRVQLLDRVATHGTKEVRDQVSAFFRGWFAQLIVRELADPAVTALAGALVETSPAEYLPRLRGVIEGAQPGELQAITGYATGAKWGPRRTLVWLLERMASFPEFFDDCEACLFRLSLEESEPHIGNNATVIWTNLFSVYLSGTACPFDRRLRLLESRTRSSISQEARLVFVALAKPLQLPGARLLGEPIVAGRVRPKDWQPATVAEETACYRAVLQICASHLNAGRDDEHHRLAFKVLADSLYFVLQRGLADDLARIVAVRSITEDESRRLLQTIDEFLEHEETRGSTARNGPATYGVYLQKVREWSNLFRPTDFVGRLRSVCARSPWDQRFVRDASKEQDDADDLGAMIAQQPGLLAEQLDWLASPEAQSAERLGFALGRIDSASDCGRMIFEHAIARRTAPLLRGYVRGMVFAQRSPGAELLALMARLEATHPDLAVDVLGYGGDGFDALNRILRLVDSGAISPRFLATLAMGIGRRELTADEVERLAPYFTRACVDGDSATALAGVRFLSTYLLFELRHAASTCLASTALQSLSWRLVEGVLPFLDAQSGSEWIEVVKKLASFDVDRAAQLLAKSLLCENTVLRDQAEKELIQLARAHPKSVMAGFGTALLDPQRGWLLQVEVCRDLVGLLPYDIVLSWVRSNGIDAAKAIARHLPVPYLDEHDEPVVPEVLEAVLREYDDNKVFANFCAGAHSGEVWWGNGGDQFRRAADAGKKFLNHPNRRIRQWARQEINDRLRWAELEDREHEERALPS